MADIPFVGKQFLHQEEVQAARLAVLYPLAVRAPNANQEQLEEAWRALIVQWRARVHALREAGFDRFQGEYGSFNYQRVRNCRPAMQAVAADAAAQPCQMNDVCPWCYARRLEKLFLAVNKDRQEEDRFYTAIGSRLVKKDVALAEPMEYMSTRLRKYAVGEFRSSRGIHWALTVEPYEGRWLFRSRWLALLGPGHVTHVLDNRWKRKLIPQATNRELITAIASVYRYPEELMRGDPRDAVAILYARRGLRLTEVSGCFRTRHNKEGGDHA